MEVVSGAIGFKKVYYRAIPVVQIKEDISALLIEKELVDKISLGILGIILNLDDDRELIDNNNRFNKDSIACFLEVGKYLDIDSDDFKRSEVFAILKSYNAPKIQENFLIAHNMPFDKGT